MMLPSMTCIKLFAAAAVLGTQVLLSTGCARRHGAPPPNRKIISTHSLWDGLGPLTISNLDVSFAPGKSPGCSSPMHRQTMGTLGYAEIREIRVTPRPEVLIFRTGTTPPALRVTDWVGAEEFQKVVADLRNAYQAWKSQHREVK